LNSTLTQPDPELLAHAVPEAELARLAGLPPGGLEDERFRDLARAARAWYAAHGRPRVFARSGELVAPGSDAVEIVADTSSVRFTSRRLARALTRSNAHALVVTVVSAGAELATEATRLWSDRPDEAWFLDRLGAALVETLVGQMRAVFEGALPDVRLLAPLAPGHDGWELAEQRLAFDFLRESGDLAPLRLTEGGMLFPAHSMLVAFGVTCEQIRVDDRAPCTTCSLTSCTIRRTV